MQIRESLGATEMVASEEGGRGRARGDGTGHIRWRGRQRETETKEEMPGTASFATMELVQSVFSVGAFFQYRTAFCASGVPGLTAISFYGDEDLYISFYYLIQVGVQPIAPLHNVV